MKQSLLLPILLLLLPLAVSTGCASSAFKQGAVAWSSTHTPLLVHYVMTDPALKIDARMQDVQTVSGLQCLIDEDGAQAGTSTVTAACACSRARSAEVRVKSCNAWAKAVYRDG